MWKRCFEHLLCGATLVQVGTQLHQEGPQVFERLAKNYKKSWQQKGYESIEEFRGKLKRCNKNRQEIFLTVFIIHNLNIFHKGFQIFRLC